MDNTRLKVVEVLINSLSISDNPNYKNSRKQLMERINEMILDAIGDNVDNRERIFSKEIKTSLFQK
ncbi:hypothetical protein [Clostridium sp.]